MPYISNKNQEREQFRSVLRNLPEIKTKGELEYCITYLMKKFMSTKEDRYVNQHDCVYAAIHAGDEWRRLYLDKREDKAREENGDVEL